MIDVSILIVSYNTKDLLYQCLKSIYSSKTVYSYEIIVVDNNSADGSVEMVEKEFPKIKKITNKKNTGFAKANNQAAAAAQGRYVWLLNSDTIVYEDTIQELLTAADKHNSWIASCQLLNRDKSHQNQGGALPNYINIASWMLNLDAIKLLSARVPAYQGGVHTIKDTQKWVGGTALLVKRDLYQSMLGLDENIFMYGEDVEFCLRAVNRGFTVDYFPKPQLIHLGQGSGSKEKSLLGEFIGLQYIARKHYPVVFRYYMRLMLKIGAFLRFVMYTIRGSKELRKTYAKAFFLA